MKKLLTIGLVSLGLISTSTFATDVMRLSTSKHNIQVTCYDWNNCTYRSWNKPKQIGQGKADFEMNGNNATGSGNWGSCPHYYFKKGNVEFELLGMEGMANFGRDPCIFGNVPKNAWGELTIEINGQRRDHYWLYSK